MQVLAIKLVEQEWISKSDITLVLPTKVKEELHALPGTVSMVMVEEVEEVVVVVMVAVAVILPVPLCPGRTVICAIVSVRASVRVSVRKSGTERQLAGIEYVKE